MSAEKKQSKDIDQRLSDLLDLAREQYSEGHFLSALATSAKCAGWPKVSSG